MNTTQQPSTFAQIIDKLRNKSEEELKLLHEQLLANDTITEASIKVAENSGSYKNYRSLSDSKTPEKETGFDEVFGIWKDKNATLDSIREEAWQRTK